MIPVDGTLFFLSILILTILSFLFWVMVRFEYYDTS